MTTTQPPETWPVQGPTPVDGAAITAERLKAKATENLALGTMLSQDVLAHIAAGGEFTEDQQEKWLMSLLCLIDSARNVTQHYQGPRRRINLRGLLALGRTAAYVMAGDLRRPPGVICA